jgi:predicted dehydrogenase
MALSDVRIAVIGAGHWGPNLIRNFHNHPRSSVTWVVDKNPHRLAAVAERFPDLTTTDDAANALASDDVDAVVIASPTTTHFPLARLALNGGKHDLVEKPLNADVGEGGELCKLAAEAGVVLMVGHVFLYNQGVVRVKQHLEAGDLGDIYYLSMTRTNLGPIRADVNAAWDLAAHDISIANYWMNIEPEAVSATGAAWINPGVEDAVFATLRYPGGVLAHLHASWLNPRKSRDITVVGERRMLTLDDMNLLEPIRIYDKGVADEPDGRFVDTFASFRASVREGDITIPPVSLGEPLSAECDHFLSCILDGVPSRTDGEFGLAVVRTLAALERSLRNGGREENLETAR